MADRQRLAQRLAQQRHHPLAVVQSLTGLGIQVGAELGKDFQLAVAGQVDTQGAGGLLDGPGLGGAAHTGDRQAHVDGGALAGEEEVALQIDLAVGDGNDVGGDIGGNVARLGLDDRQGRHGTAAVLLGQAAGALQQTGVQVEDVAGVSLTAGGAAQQQRQGTVCHRVLGQVVVDDEHVPALGHEVLADGGTGVGSHILHGRRLAGCGGNDDAVIHGAVLFQRLTQAGDGGGLLADAHVDADHILTLLVQNGVDGDRGLAGLTVADDQFTLAAADGDHGVDGQDAGLHGLGDRFTADNAGSLMLDGAGLGALDGAQAVDGAGQGIHGTADEAVAHRHIGGTAGAADNTALGQAFLAAQQHNTGALAAQVQDDAGSAVLEFHQLAVDSPAQAGDIGDAVADLNDMAGLGGHGVAGVALQRLFHLVGQFVQVGVGGAVLNAFCQAVETALDAAVVGDAVHIQHKAAQQGGIDLDLQHGIGGAAQLADRLADGFLGGLVRLTGAGHQAVDAALGSQGQAGELHHDLGQGGEVILLRQQGEKCFQLVVAVQAGGAGDELLLFSGGDGRALQRVPQLGVRHQGVGGFAHGLGIAVHGPEQGRRVTLGRFAHCSSPTFAKNSSASARSESVSRRLPATSVAAITARRATSPRA